MGLLLFLLMNTMSIVYLVISVPALHQQMSDVHQSLGIQDTCKVISIIDNGKINGSCGDVNCAFTVGYTSELSNFYWEQSIPYSNDDDDNNDGSQPDYYQPVNSLHPCWSHDFYHEPVVIWQRSSVDHIVKANFVIGIVTCIVPNFIFLFILLKFVNDRRIVIRNSSYSHLQNKIYL